MSSDSQLYIVTVFNLPSMRSARIKKPVKTFEGIFTTQRIKDVAKVGPSGIVRKKIEMSDANLVSADECPNQF